MQFNDTTNLNGLIQSCEFWTGLGQSQISGDTTRLKEFTRLINNNYHKVVDMIMDSADGWDYDDTNHADTGFIKVYNLVKDQRYVKLPVSDKILKLKRVEVKLDGTNWYRAHPMDVNEFGGAVMDTSDIGDTFSKEAPYYDMRGQYLYLYPIPGVAVTGGLAIWVTREVDEFTTADTTQTPGIAKQFHELIAVGASMDYALAKGLENSGGIVARFFELEERLRKYYGSREEDRIITVKPAYTSYE